MNGLWDFVHHSISGFRRHPSDSFLSRIGSRDAFICARCRAVIQPGGRRCKCARLGMLPTILSGSSPDQIVHGLRSGARSLSANALWSTLELSAQGVRTVQTVFEVSFYS